MALATTTTPTSSAAAAGGTSRSAPGSSPSDATPVDDHGELLNRQIGAVEPQFFYYGDELHPIELDSGERLNQVKLAYETYGTLNADKSNAILLFHALTASQHAAGECKGVSGVDNLWNRDCVAGWWDEFIGPDRALDTNRFFVICANYLGGCYGSTGPRSIDPRTGRPYGSRFPSISVHDIVDSQMKLLDHLGIETLHACVGASIGGMMCLSLATRYPGRVNIVVPIATGAATTPLQKIHNFEQIYAIEQDNNFRGGDYYDGEPPHDGLALARMIGHKTFISLSALSERAQKTIRSGSDDLRWYKLRSSMESYMRYQGRKFVQRFDANSYLRIIDAWQQFDLYEKHGVEDLAEVFRQCQHQRYMVFTIDSDVCFYPDEQQELVAALKKAEVNCMHITVHSEKGHDAFLLEPELFTPHLSYTLH